MTEASTASEREILTWETSGVAIRDIARQVIAASGPSGPNIEYVLLLEKSLAKMKVTDPHVSEVAAMIRSMTGAN